MGRAYGKCRWEMPAETGGPPDRRDGSTVPMPNLDYDGLRQEHLAQYSLRMPAHLERLTLGTPAR